MAGKWIHLDDGSEMFVDTMGEDKCPIHGCGYEWLPGRPAHVDNQYCPKCWGGIVEPTEVEARCDRLTTELREANKLLRSCYTVAERDGKDTNWPGLVNAIRELLNRHHELRLWYEEANSEAYSSAQEIADLRDELDRRRWISVDDRLPKPTAQAGGKEVVPVILSVNGFVGEGLYCENCKHQWTLDGVEVNPTHWMPLPPPPDKNTSTREDPLAELAKQAQDLDMGY